ncbi:MAG: murein L,D-transpeptidase catalytic domain family protein [Flavobacteriales bacterium]|jgi:hypothetical protein|nr:murein L,D-transpeptidase catalytic domain family protein [Flavobacteriales bacterium]
MKIISILSLLFLLTSSFTHIDHEEDLSPSPKEIEFKAYIDCFYETLGESSLNYSAFQTALKGYFELKALNKLENDRYLTIIDMSASANTERFYLVDVYHQTIVYQSLVAHGMATGEEFAKDFSNIENSHQSSLGFYLTGETYNGRHDFSLKLDGLEYSNNKARERGIVIHAANYVSHEYIASNGRLGRSYGCPALPFENYFDIVSKIKNKSCLFIYYPERDYARKTKLGGFIPNKRLLEN